MSYPNAANSLQAFRQNIQKLNGLVNQLENIQQQIGTSKDSPDLRKRVLNIQTLAKSAIEASQKNLKELGNFGVSGDLKIQKEKLTDELFKLVKKFQTISQSVLAKEKEAESLKSSSNNYDENNNVLVSFSNDGFNNRTVSPQQTQIQKQTNEYEQVKERKQQFSQLEADIVDLNSMFKDLAVMVHDQGQEIDTIEKNIGNSELAVEAATIQLQEATKYQSKARRKRCIIILIVLIVLIIIAAIVILSLKPWTW